MGGIVHGYGRWRKKRKFFILFASILLLIGIYPFFADRHIAGVSSSTLLTALVCLGAITAVADNRKRLVASVVLAVIAISSVVFAIISPTMMNQGISLVMMIIFYLFTIGTLISHVLKPREFTTDAVFGAVSIFLLIGITTATGCALIDTIQPGSFGYPASYGSTHEGTYADFLYLSFITLTSCGYGDIIPLTPVAQTLLFMTSVTGIMYIAILVAGLVGSIIAHRTHDQR